jgi:hypothetical protein
VVFGLVRTERMGSFTSRLNLSEPKHLLATSPALGLSFLQALRSRLLVALVGTWEERLHTRARFGLNDNAGSVVHRLAQATTADALHRDLRSLGISGSSRDCPNTIPIPQTIRCYRERSGRDA